MAINAGEIGRNEEVEHDATSPIMLKAGPTSIQGVQGDNRVHSRTVVGPIRFNIGVIDWQSLHLLDTARGTCNWPGLKLSKIDQSSSAPEQSHLIPLP